MNKQEPEKLFFNNFVKYLYTIKLLFTLDFKDSQLNFRLLQGIFCALKHLHLILITLKPMDKLNVLIVYWSESYKTIYIKLFMNRLDLSSYLYRN